MQGVYCPRDVHWARLEAAALGGLLPAPYGREGKERGEIPVIGLSVVRGKSRPRWPGWYGMDNSSSTYH